MSPYDARTRITPERRQTIPIAEARRIDAARLLAIEAHIAEMGWVTPEDMPTLERARRTYRVALGIERGEE